MSAMKTDRSYGIIPIALHDAGHEYFVVHQQEGHWAFPKGHAEDGDEDSLATAKRELEEETGLRPTHIVSSHPFTEQYTFTRDGATFDKTVVFYLGLIEHHTHTLQEAEIQDSAWLSYDEARTRLTFDQARSLLDEVEEYLQTHQPFAS